MTIHRQRGFTLIEVLVVMVIIGVLITFAVLSLGDGGKRDKLMEESKRLTALINLASEQAVMEGREWGMYVAADGYLFMVLRDGKWQEVAGDDMFRVRHLTEGFTLELRMDDVKVTLTPPPDEEVKDSSASPSPQVFLMSSAERTPFELVVTAPGGAPVMIVKAPMVGDAVLHEAANQ